MGVAIKNKILNNTTMTKDSIVSLVRYALLAIGAYLVGKNFLGSTIDNELWQGIMGAIFALGGAIWGWIDKTATLEQIQSGFRSAFAFLGVMLVGSGIIKSEVLESFIGGLPIILSWLYSQTSKAKNKQIATGQVKIADLKGVDPTKKITPDTSKSTTTKK